MKESRRQAAAAVLEDLVQETGGLWVVLGTASLGQFWITCICTSEETAREIIADCERWHAAVEIIRSSSWARNDDVDWFLQRSPDMGMRDNREKTFPLRLEGASWRVLPFCSTLAAGVFGPSHELPEESPEEPQRQFHSFRAETHEFHGTWFKDYAATIYAKDAATDIWEVFEESLSFHREHEAYFWAATRLAVLRGHDLMDSIEDATQTLEKETSNRRGRDVV